MDVSKVCRTCLKENDEQMKSIYEAIAIDGIDQIVMNSNDGIVGDANVGVELFQQETTIHNMIAECVAKAALDIDDLPKQMCHRCVEELKTSYIFKNQCERAFKHLRSMLLVDVIPLHSKRDTVCGVRPSDKFTQTDCSNTLVWEAANEKLPNKLAAKQQRAVHTKSAAIEIVMPGYPSLADNCCEICKVQFKRKARLKKHMETMHQNKLKRVDVAGSQMMPATIGHRECYSCNVCGRLFDSESKYLEHSNCDSSEDVRNLTADTGHLSGKENADDAGCPIVENIVNFEISEGGELVEVNNAPSHEAFIEQMTGEEFSFEINEQDNHGDADDIDHLLSKRTTQIDVTLPAKNVKRKAKRGRPKKQIQKQKSKQREAQKKLMATSVGTLVKPGDPHQCSECDKTFTRATHLKRHMTIHSEERPFSCDLCDKKFRRADHLRIHQHHHATVKPHTCEHCQRGFTRIEHVRRHILSRHSGRPPLKKEYICDICKRGFTTQKYLQVHIKSHSERTYNCKFCEQKFETKADLAEHAKCHANEKPYLCSECGLRFVRNDYLVIHMRRHKGEKPYKCKFCSKGFPRATDLTVHERYHTGERSHMCSVCGKGFQRAYNLLVHMRVHTGEKPYQCPHCVKRFAQGNDLKAHVRRHTGERYKCDVCEAGFIQGYHLTQHKRNAHGIDMKSHIRRVAKFLPNVAEDAAADNTMDDQLDDKHGVFQVITDDSHQLYNAHDSMDMDHHQILVPIGDGQQIQLHPQQTIVILQGDNTIKLEEPSIGQNHHDSHSSEIYGAHGQQYHQLHQ